MRQSGSIGRAWSGRPCGNHHCPQWTGVLAVGNGYLGLRGNYSESRDAHVEGTYINGFHETWPILHAEEAFGFARIGQTIVNAPDAKVIRLYVDDEPLQMSVADLLEYERALDFRSGELSRELVWRTPGGKEVRIRSTRMVPLAQRHLAVLSFEVTLLDEQASVAISSQLLNRQDAVAEPGRGHRDRGGRPAQGRPLRTPGARAGPALRRRGDRPVVPRLPRGPERDDDRRGRRPRAADRSPHSMQVHAEADLAKVIYRVAAQPGVPIRLTKLVSYHTPARCRRAS